MPNALKPKSMLRATPRCWYALRASNFIDIARIHTGFIDERHANHGNGVIFSGCQRLVATGSLAGKAGIRSTRPVAGTDLSATVKPAAVDAGRTALR